MKKILLSLLLAFVCLQVSHAQNLPLSFADVKTYNGNAFNAATGVITFNNNWNAAAGWEFTPAIDKGKYVSVKLEFESVTAHLIEVKIKYAGGGEDYMSVPEGTTALIVPFTKNVEQIYFQVSNWECCVIDDNCTNIDFCFDTNPNKTLTIKSATLVASVPTIQENINFGAVPNGVGEWWGATVDAAAKCITFKYRYEAVPWLFETTPLSNDVYLGAVFSFKEPLPSLANHFTLGIVYTDNTEASVEASTGATGIQINFAKPVKKLSLTISNWECSSCNDNEIIPSQVVCFNEAYFLKKAPLGLSDLTVTPGALVPAFSPGTTSYTVNVASSVESISIEATSNYGDASVSGAGTKTLAFGSNSFPIKVTLGAEEVTYNITVIRDITAQTPVAKDATGVIHNSFIANWEASDYATDYLLSVFKREGEVTEPVTVFSEDFSSIVTGNSIDTNGSGSTWTRNANFSASTNVYQAGGAVRLGTSSATGSLTTKQLDLSSGQITVRFKMKGWTANGSVQVRVNSGTAQTVTCTGHINNSGVFEQKELTFPAATATSTVVFTTTSGSSTYRCFLDDIEVIVDKTVPAKVYVLEDFPTGKVNSYAVPGLTPETTYYYTLKAKLSESVLTGSSNEIEVTTTEMLDLETLLAKLVQLQADTAALGAANRTLETKLAAAEERISDLIDELQACRTSVRSVSAETLQMVPNPATNLITISGLQINETIRIYDIKGNVLFMKEAAQETENIAIGHLSAGAYLVKAGNKVMKLIKN